MAGAPPRKSGLEALAQDRIENSLCSGGLISPDEWIAVATANDAKSDFKPGFSLPRDFSAGEKDHVRQLYRGKVNTSETRPRIESSECFSATEYRAATFLRATPGGAILQAKNPGSLFLLHRTGKELFAPFTLTRMGADGKAIWDTATSLGRLQQVLPGMDNIALIGERPPMSNKVSEPVLVFVNIATGATNAVSLWR